MKRSGLEFGKALVNGFGLEDWTKVKHSLVIRFASELEAEHALVLQTKINGDAPQFASMDVMRALENELVARGLLALSEEKAKSHEVVHGNDLLSGLPRIAVITTLGKDFLALFTAPSSTAEPNSESAPANDEP